MTLPNIPKLVDAHVHLRCGEGVESLLAAGIVAARNAGMKPEGSYTGCRDHGNTFVINSCRALFKSGGYGGLFGVPVSTMEEAKTEIGKLKKAGADIIKVMASGMVSLKNPGAVTAGGFDKDELKFIAGEAAAQGLNVMAHANGEPAITAATAAGVLSIEHGFFMTSSALKAMAEKRTYWTPTTGALVRAVTKTGTGGSKEFVAGLVRHHLDMIKTAYRLGVPLAVGTDCMLPDTGYRAAYEAELRYFEDAGISRVEVMRIATESSARLLSLSSELRVRSSK